MRRTSRGQREPCERRWSALTSTRFLRTGVEQRVGVNALHLGGDGFVDAVSFDGMAAVQGTAGRGVAGAAVSVSFAGGRPGARAVRMIGPDAFVLCTMTCA